MPIYTYKCKKCGEVFEFLHKSLSANEKVVCEKCGAKDVEKMLSSFSVGSGGSSSLGSAPSCPTCCPGGSCSLG